MVYINPKWIIVDFLRNLMTDPRSTRTYTANSDTYTATASQTEFSMTPSSGTTVSHITSVTIDAVTSKKWRDYYIDFRAQTITFFTAMTGGEEVIINFKESSTNWIYWDKPDESLSETSFPRLDVMTVTGSGSRLGEYEAPVESIIQFQVDVWCKEKAENQIFTIGDRAYTGLDLAEYLAYQVMEKLEDNENDLHPVMYDYTPTQIPPRDLPFNIQYQAHHKIAEFTVKGLKLGRVS